MLLQGHLDGGNPYILLCMFTSALCSRPCSPALVCCNAKQGTLYVLQSPLPASSS